MLFLITKQTCNINPTVLKGTVSINSCDPNCKEGNTRCTMVPWSIMWKGFSCVILIIPIITASLEKPQLKIISFQNYKHGYIIHTWSDKVFKDTTTVYMNLHWHSYQAKKVFQNHLKFFLQEVSKDPCFFRKKRILCVICALDKLRGLEQDDQIIFMFQTFSCKCK